MSLLSLGFFSSFLQYLLLLEISLTCVSVCVCVYVEGVSYVCVCVCVCVSCVCVCLYVVRPFVLFVFMAFDTYVFVPLMLK